MTSSPLLAQAKTRLWWAAFAFMVGYFAVALRLADLTLLQSRPVQEAMQKQQLMQDVKPLEKPLRGAIVDRNGTLLATSLKMPSVYADATMVEDPKKLAGQLADILPDESRADLEDKLASDKKFIWIHRDVTPKQEYAINALGSPALNFQEEERRIYPSGALASHVLGYTDLDGSGISGIEKSFDAQLKKGDTPVALTLDLRVQHIMHRELANAVKKFSAKKGVGMVMDVNTGEILSMVSLPDFDPHHPGDASDDAKFNNASLGVFEMGSTFKLFSMAAALDSGKVDFNSNFDAAQAIHYGRFTISDYHAKGRMLSVPEIFIYSSNIGTARMAMTIGGDALQSFYKKMGFFAQAPIDFPERGWPIYPKPWSDVSTLTASFGHGIAVSPVHLMRAASSLVNGGVMVTPTLAQQDAKHLSLTPVGERVISEETSRKILKLLELTVAEGTGSQAYVPGYGVGGKTGTAEKNAGGHYIHNRVLSSFIGVFPVKSPRYAVLAILDEPQGIPETHGFVTGGWTAAPVVAQVISQMGPLYHMPPDLDTSHDIMSEMGMYLKEAKGKSSIASLGTDQ